MNRAEWKRLHVTLVWTQMSAETSRRSAGKALLRVNCWTVHSGVKRDYRDACQALKTCKHERFTRWHGGGSWLLMTPNKNKAGPGVKKEVKCHQRDVTVWSCGPNSGEATLWMWLTDEVTFELEHKQFRWSSDTRLVSTVRILETTLEALKQDVVTTTFWN